MPIKFDTKIITFKKMIKFKIATRINKIIIFLINNQIFHASRVDVRLTQVTQSGNSLIISSN